MLTCPNCGTDNQDNAVYCFNCGAMLSMVVGTTSRLETDPTIAPPRRRWGTARFDIDMILMLSPRDFDAGPLRVVLERDMVIGRTHEDFTPDVDLSRYEAYERGVSRQHALLRRQNDTITLVDMHSANSTFLNGQRLVPDQPRILRDGDEIRLGQLVLRVTFEDGFNN